MRPLFNKESLWVYPVYAGLGGGVGYWLMGVEQRQTSYLKERRDSLLEKRRRRAEREGVVVENEAGELQGKDEGLVEGAKNMIGLKDDDDDNETTQAVETGVRKTGVELQPEEGRGASLR